MKAKFYLLALMVMMFTGNEARAQRPQGEKKVLVAYFSYSGNTEVVANQIKEATGGDIFEIVPEKAYSSDYQTVVDQAKKEINAGYKPALKGMPKDIGGYDVIIVGSPCWWGTIAPPIATFLSECDLSRKTILPFMTHEGSRMGHTLQDIKKLCPQSVVSEGLPVRGGRVKDAKPEVVKWLQENKLVR